MKLATYKDGSRDGQLVVVSRDLTSAHYASGIASRLQQVLDDWNFLSPQLQDLSSALNAGRARHPFPFDAAQCMAPLPRAFLRWRGSAYPSPVGAEADATALQLRLAGSAPLLGACDDLVAADEAQGIDFEGEIVVVTGDVPQGATPEQGLDAVRLLMLGNAAALRDAAAPPGGLPAAFSPVAVTPDELGDAWQDGRVHLALQVSCNGRKLGLCDAGPDMRWPFGALVAAAARTHRLPAGTLVGSGPVRNPGVPNQDGRLEWPRGASSLLDRRAVEVQQGGAPTTDYLKFGDSVRIEMKGRDGRPVFGAIEQKVVKFGVSD